MKHLVEIAKLNRTGLQTRAALNAEAVRDYAEIMRESPDALPPIEVYGDYLADGFHRIAAALSLGLTEIAAEVHEGDYKTALLAALKANTTHGMRRTNADKRQAMRVAWKNRLTLFGGTPSERDFASACCVSKSCSRDFLAGMKVVETTTPHPASKRRASSTAADADRFGLEIPEALCSAFASKRLNAALSLLQKARRLLKEGVGTNDLGLAALAWQRTDISMENVSRELRFAKPFCVCRMCRGSGCGACHDRGFQTKLEYEQNPAEYNAAPIDTIDTIESDKASDKNKDYKESK